MKPEFAHENERQDRRPGRGIYLLPNLFTTAGLFAGFYAIVTAMKGGYDSAAMAIFVAMIMDALDGRVARLTNTQSAFGGEFDSLADMTSFGIAPALVVFSWSLETLHKLGWLAAFLYAAAGALRLARFNTQISKADKRYFQGLPIPAAAGVIAAMVWLAIEYKVSGSTVNYLVAFVTILLAILMVSNIRFHSFKQVDLRGRVPFVAVLIVVLVYVGISLDPPTILAITFFSYALSGPILTLWRLRQTRAQRRHSKLANHKDTDQDLT